MSLRTRRVVTAFLRHRGRILLLQRSRKVATYRGCWGGISGRVELPEDLQVYVEILQETGLTSREVTLVQKGSPLRVTDRAIGIRWIITPYLFDCRTPRVRLNWEHTRCRFVRPGEIATFPTAPRLMEGLGHVHPPFRGMRPGVKRRVQRGLHSIAHDRHRGARELAADASQLMHGIRSEPIHLQKQVAHSLGACRPLMPGIQVAARRAHADSFRSPRSHAEGTALRSPDSQSRPSPGTARRLNIQIEKSGAILTHSYSSTVVSILQGLRDWKGTVYATRSDPPGEGRKTARVLREKGFACTLIRDSHVASILPDISLILVGADAVIPGRGFINKTGTRRLARMARRRDIPFIVVADRNKNLQGAIAPRLFPDLLRALDPDRYFEYCALTGVSRMTRV